MQDFKFRLFGMTWEVVGIDEDNIFADGHHGLCVPQELKIYYHKGDAHDQQINTVIHESIHAIETTLDQPLTEEQVCGQAAGWHMCMLDPNWRKAVLGKGK